MVRQDEPDEPTLVRLVSRHLGTASGTIQLRRISTGKFSTSYYVHGGPMPLVLRIAPTNDRSRVLFYEHQMMRQEPTLHALLRKQTDVPLPAILQRLAQAAHRDPTWKVFGVLGHQYKLNPPLSVSVVEALERHHAV
jgi:aminoglycoside phosphotransferase (APT) family kinase protein